MKPIPVVIIVNDFLYGGAQKVVIDTIRLMDRTLYKPHIVTLREFPDRKDLYSDIPTDVPVYRLNFHNIRDIGEWYTCFKTCRDIRPRVVVSHLFFSNTVARVLKLFLGFQVIAVEHNTYDKKTRMQILVDRLLSYVTFKIVCVSQTVAEFTQKQQSITPDKFMVIHNGIRTEEIQKKIQQVDKTDVRSSLHIGLHDHVAINIARLTPQKDHALLIEGFAGFVTQHPDWHLFIFGEGSEYDDLVKLIVNYNLERNVHLMGITDRIVNYLAISDCLVSASRIEGLSIAYLEALAVGVPIVATRTAGTDEIVISGYNGFFIEERNALSVTRALEQFVSTKPDVMKANARESSKKFDAYAMVQKYQALIDQALNN